MDLVRRRAGTEHRGDGVARHEVDQHEREERDAEQLHHADADPAHDVGSHRYAAALVMSDYLGSTWSIDSFYFAIHVYCNESAPKGSSSVPHTLLRCAFKNGRSI